MMREQSESSLRIGGHSFAPIAPAWGRPPSISGPLDNRASPDVFSKVPFTRIHRPKWPLDTDAFADLEATGLLASDGDPSRS